MAKAKKKSAIKKISTPIGPKALPGITGKKSPSFNLAQMTRKKKGGSKVG